MKTTADNLQIIYEDNHLIIVNKRAGDLVQGDQTGDVPLNEIVKSYIADKYNKPGQVFLGVVHRLDRPTSGAVVFARTSKSLERMNKLLRDRQVDKTYWALVDGKVQDQKASLVNYLKKNAKNNKSTASDREFSGSKKAVLHYEKLLELDRYTLLKVNLETGRHHQIRCQLSNIGHPIKGDLKYGFKRPNRDGGIHLHARNISFIHPVKKELLHISADLPEDTLWQVCKKKLEQ